MFSIRLIIAAAVASCALAACSQPAPQAAPKAQAKSADAYLAPPRVTAAALAGDSVRLSGEAPAGARVRLASPAGQALFVGADANGRWTVVLPSVGTARILGISAEAGARIVQGQGYLLVTSAGQAALLRAGAGAVRLDRLPAVAIGAVDFDGEGGAVVSGQAPANANVSVRLDGIQTADGRADATGRFSISLPEPVRAGQHALEVAGDGFAARASVAFSDAAPLTTGPFRSEAVGAGLRADWMTPGGGLQSTVIIG